MTTVTSNIRTFRQCGADEIILNLGYFHEGQCNLEFAAHQLEQVAALRIPFTISCYETRANEGEAV